MQFLLGFIVGGISGIVLMAIVVAWREEEREVK